MVNQNSTIGRCRDCTIGDLNTGPYGYYLSISNCKCDKECVCDIYANVFDKRHECIGTTSIFECLYDNPTKVIYNGEDITNSLTREKPGEGVPPSKHPDGYINDGRSIESGELSITLLQRLARPCGEGVGNYYQGELEPGCLPYSGSIISNEPKEMNCYDGSFTGFKSCCNGEMACNDSVTKGCNPCISILRDIPKNDTVWQDDICYFFCPSYWQQRTQYLGSETQGGFFKDETQICSDKYITLCELAGCTPDPACKIHWGGCSYSDIDKDICNGGDWSSPFLGGYTPIDRCKQNSKYCTQKKLCETQEYKTKCTNDPQNVPYSILPTVVRSKV